MDSSDSNKPSSKGDSRKVIDLTERLQAKSPLNRIKALKVRLDLEQAKVAIPASLLSILIVVTLANSKLLNSSSDAGDVQSREVASEGSPTGTLIPSARGIASIPTGTSESEDTLVKRMSEKTLNDAAAIGRKPSALERFTIETLEGRYAVRVNDQQKVSEIEIAGNQVNQPVAFDAQFIEKNREWMPVSFDRSVRVRTQEFDGGQAQTFHLVNTLSMPVGRVDVRLDQSGRLLSLKAAPMAAAVGH